MLEVVPNMTDPNTLYFNLLYTQGSDLMQFITRVVVLNAPFVFDISEGRITDVVVFFLLSDFFRSNFIFTSNSV